MNNVFDARSEGEWTELGGGMRRRVRAHNPQLMLVEVGFDAGARASDHSHPHTQISYVLSGEFTYHIQGEAHTLKAGDSIVVDGGRLHGCTAITGGTLLDVFTPAREDFIK